MELKERRHHFSKEGRLPLEEEITLQPRGGGRLLLGGSHSGKRCSAISEAKNH